MTEAFVNSGRFSVSSCDAGGALEPAIGYCGDHRRGAKHRRQLLRSRGQQGRRGTRFSPYSIRKPSLEPIMTPLSIQSRLIRISLAIALMSAAHAHAHFQELIPSTDIVNAETGNALTLEMRFTHPMEGGPLMVMGEPVRLGVLSSGGREDLKSRLQAQEIDGKLTYRLDYRIKQPGDYVFYLDPAA
jgi:hypothetical protein